MARSSLAFAAATLAMLAASVPSSATARPRSFSQRGCAASAHRAGHAMHATGSIKHAHCPKGHVHKGHARHHSSSHRLFFTAHDGKCRDSGLAPAAKNLEAVRAATLCLVNRERAAHGEPALHWNNHLVKAAQAHTESMAFGNYFEHVGPGGETPLSRMRHDGYIYSSRLGYEVGENIGWGSLWLGTPKAVVAAWMASPGHRANILDRRFRDTGIGVSPHLGSLAHGQSGGIYTQDFGVIVTG
jgi:uncharacterized protein YkwD